jgi:hypothetical protein
MTSPDPQSSDEDISPQRRCRGAENTQPVRRFAASLWYRPRLVSNMNLHNLAVHVEGFENGDGRPACRCLAVLAFPHGLRY